jgi:transcriptional regulator with XRE-family HTH domain
MIPLKNVIKRLIDKRGWTIRDLASRLSMSEQNLYKCFQKNNIMYQDLLEISKVLDVHPRIFFEEGENENGEYPVKMKEEYIEILEELREVYQENRDLHKKVHDLEAEMVVLNKSKQLNKKSDTSSAEENENESASQNKNKN